MASSILGSGIIPKGTSATLTEAAIDFSTTGNNTVVSGVANKTVRVFRIFFVCSAATNITIKDGSDTALTGAMSMSANGGFTLDAIGEAWFRTSAGNAFVIHQSGTAQISGRVYYQQS